MKKEDGDGHRNWQEYWAGTSPTTSAEVLRCETAPTSESAVIVRWPAAVNVRYGLEAATGGPIGFATIATNLVPVGGWGSHTDTVQRPPPVFDRIAAERMATE